jgi:hypothetical protein
MGGKLMPLVIYAIFAALSVAMTGYSAISQGQAQARMSAYNSMIAKQNATLAAKQIGIARTEKSITEEKAMSNTNRVLASERAAYAKAGVNLEGSSLMAEATTQSNAELDALAIRYAGTVEQSQILANVAGQRQQEMLEKMKGKMYSQSGYLQAGSSLLSGVSDVASKWKNK